MLCVTRRVGDEIIIDGQITIKIISLKHGAVMVGIDAPKECEIHRKEVYEKIYGKEKERD